MKPKQRSPEIIQTFDGPTASPTPLHSEAFLEDEILVIKVRLPPPPQAASHLPAQPQPALQHSADEPLAYSVKDAAKMLSISQSQMYELIQNKLVPRFYIGRRMYVSRAALVRYIQQHEY